MTASSIPQILFVHTQTHTVNARRSAVPADLNVNQLFVEQKDVICSVAQETHSPLGPL